MKKINDREEAEKLMKKYLPLEGAGLEPVILTFEKGELLTRQKEKTDYLMLIYSGSVKIYGILNDGGISPVNFIDAPMMIGDYDYTNHDISPFFSEAASPVSCLALSMKDCHRLLDDNVQFLHMLLKSYADKIRLFSKVDSQSTNLEDRVLLYLEHEAPAHRLTGMDKAAMTLRCSRRQLQRVLKKLCETGRIEKTGRGSYRLLPR